MQPYSVACSIVRSYHSWWLHYRCIVAIIAAGICSAQMSTAVIVLSSAPQRNKSIFRLACQAVRLLVSRVPPQLSQEPKCIHAWVSASVHLFVCACARAHPLHLSWLDNLSKQWMVFKQELIKQKQCGVCLGESLVVSVLARQEMDCISGTDGQTGRVLRHDLAQLGQVQAS